MRNRLAVVASAIAFVLAPAAIVACGGDDNKSSSSTPARQQRRQGAAAREGHDPDALDDAQLAQAQGRPRQDDRAVHGEDRRQGRRRRGRLGRPVRPHPQRRGLGRGPRHHAGGHDPGAVLRGTRRASTTCRATSRTSAARRPTPRGSGTPPRSRARTGSGRSRGSPRRARSTTARTCSRRPASTPPPPSPTSRRSRPRCRRSRTRCPGIQPFGAPGKKAFDLVHNVMPFVWDNGGAELSDDAKKSTINTPEAQTGVRVHGQPDPGRPVRQEPARA